jgi:hypothetical protein
MTNAKDLDTLASLMLRIRAVLGMLIAQFLLGMGVNLIGNPGTTVSKAVESIFLGLHVLLAIGLIVVATLTMRLAVKLGGQWPRLTRIGASGVGLAFIGGIGTMASQGAVSSWLSYLMSIGFILAFAGYSFVFAKLSAAKAAH